MKKQWHVTDVPDQSEKVIVITGTTSGLGNHTTRTLSSKNANVITSGRRLDLCEEQSKVFRTLGRGSVETLYLDLGDLSSVHIFADQILSTQTRLDVLVNNAGIMAAPYRKTQDGFESQIGINYIGHWVLTARLMPLIKNTPGARVVNVTSNAESIGYIPLLLRDFNQEKFYERWLAYGHSKLANVVFTYELQRQFTRHNIDATSMAVHPGFVQTELRESRLEEPNFIYRMMMHLFHWLSTWQTLEMGCLPILYAATDPDAEGGAYYSVQNPLQLFGYPRKRRSSPQSYSTKSMEALWRRTEELTGVRFEFS